ncbi:Methionine S-methyltransferase [Olea europaea subsp. europaea]|uniref:methionine S-methyltransferase n=1 Tax=Olea europaea subsp. europaea TaxID=158383 RepID=A0A8S0SJ07_OLEEU|nr:Methionine S-methyltransferase [Olea europaea subsp. europaea]
MSFVLNAYCGIRFCCPDATHWEYVICILNPNPDAMSKMITENASEEFLHSLSNYCAIQGFVEDQFGLGLIARAVEEGISVINPLGIMIFNMGGRPGQAVCERLFERRGLRINKLWQTKILQAADTDISALVEIEKNSRHRFEFFMGLVGDAAYSALRSLLERLENPNTRKDARIFLAELHKRFDSKEASEKCLETYHFQIEDIYVEQYEGFEKRKKLTLMVIPSIFIPEDWSFTFYEGINRHPDSIFKEKTVAELGCGNGWISIAIAEKWSPLKVYGLDINPRAVKISWINLYLNALDDSGLPIYDGEKKTLLDRVEFHESDLLSYCRDNHIELERIVGCIPQILNPNPDAMSKMITENASEEFLHSLSNYCAIQGFVEDQFGLGLIARAVEEGISVINPLGIMIFNMGGRPGQAVCERLFERRGLRINKLWQTKILQAADTDISALVEIEKNSRHRFEFFMGLVGDQPICARTAWTYAKAGGRISHALSVYSCQLRQPNQVKKIFEFLRNGFHDISSSLDLSFEDDSVADEKIPFLAYLTNVLKEISFFPYEQPAGSKRFRSLISSFMRTYHRIPLTADNVVVFPSRTVAIESALRLLSPRLAIVDEQLTRHLPRQWLTSLNIEILWSISVIKRHAHLKSSYISVGFHISLKKRMSTSNPWSNLATNVYSQCTLLLSYSTKDIHYLYPTVYGCIVNFVVTRMVYSDLEVAFVISEEATMFKALSKTVELLQGNTAIISQYYYGCLFHELLAFQLADRHPPAQRVDEKAKTRKAIGFSSSAISVLDHAELSINETSESSLIHMDVDQSFLPITTPVKAAIFESFARQNIAESETDVTSGIKQLIHSSYGFASNGNTELIYADCPEALFNKLVLCCIQEGGTFCFPTGSNGNYVSAAKFLKAVIINVQTNPEVGFKLTEKTLANSLENVHKPWVYISGPTVNPTGLVYSNEEMKTLLTVCAEFGARVVLDTSFSGVEFNSKGQDGWDLDATLEKLSSNNPDFCASLLGGLFFKMLTGGIKFGFLLLNQASLVDAFHGFGGLSKPHRTIKYTLKKLLDLQEGKSKDLVNAIAEKKELLESRYKQLKETLEDCGWEVLEAQAGVSIVAKPSAYLGKNVKIKNDSSTRVIKLDDSNIREAMLLSTGLCINSAVWTGIPGYCRFTFALEESDFKRALDCITKFKSIVAN